MKGFFKRLSAGFRREDGTATLEFAISLPVLMMIFTGSFESGLLMTRSIMLEQAVDRTMRELRLGHYPIPTADLLKDEICDRALIFTQCRSLIVIEMTRITTDTFILPSTNVACVDRDADIQPVTALQIGQQNDIMLVRVCVIQNALLPGTGLGLGLKRDSAGGYSLVAVSAFVTEPT